VSGASPLDLLHPAGTIRTMLVLGENVPQALLPAAAASATANVDLVLIAPARRELAAGDWLSQAAQRAETALGQDGLVYALLPRRVRRRGCARLRSAGLALDARLVSLPRDGPVRYLVPLRAGPWEYAFGSLITARPLARQALLAARSLPFGESLLSVALPAAAIVARRPGERRAAAWIGGLDGKTPDTHDTVLAAGWRGRGGSTLLHCFGHGASEPWGVVKVAPGASFEADLLDRLGPGAREAGARVPLGLARGSVAGRSVVAETAVPGAPAARILLSAPGRVDEITAAVVRWLERWNAATARVEEVGAQTLMDELTNAADALSPVLPESAAYRRRLVDACAVIEDSDVPLVATHNDLTMWNVTADPAGSIGILDWAEAEPAGLPLTDFFYAAADAAAAGRGYRSRLDAVQACFPTPGTGAGALAALRARMVAAVGVSPAAADLCFHACWLAHARNEVEKGGGSGEFLEVARWLVSTPVAGRR
jgi:hypothetical protein